MTSKNFRDTGLSEQEPAPETRQGNTPNKHTPTTRARRHVLQERAKRLQFNWVFRRFHLYSSHSDTLGFGRVSSSCTALFGTQVNTVLQQIARFPLHMAYSYAYGLLATASSAYPASPQEAFPLRKLSNSTWVPRRETIPIWQVLNWGWLVTPSSLL